MACMEYDCRDCGADWCSNKKYDVCPECGSTNIVSFFDALPDSPESESESDSDSDSELDAGELEFDPDYSADIEEIGEDD